MTDIPTLRHCPDQQRCASEDEGSGDLDALRLLDKIYSQKIKGVLVVTLATSQHASAFGASLALQISYDIQKLRDHDR